MENSILGTIKKLLGGAASGNAFDTDIIVHINTYFGILNQRGVGQADGFSITDATALWSGFEAPDGCSESVKTYIYLSVKLVFDPPQGQAALTAMKQEADRLEWYLAEAAKIS